MTMITFKEGTTEVVLDFTGALELGTILGCVDLLKEGMRLYNSDGHEVGFDYEVDSDDGDIIFEIRVEAVSGSHSNAIH